VSGAIAHAVARFGRLDCIFNNRGRRRGDRADRGDPGGGLSMRRWACSSRGVFLGMKHAAPVMKRQGGGSIISTASVAGLQAGFGPHVYSRGQGRGGAPDPLGGDGPGRCSDAHPALAPAPSPPSGQVHHRGLGRAVRREPDARVARPRSRC